MARYVRLALLGSGLSFITSCPVSVFTNVFWLWDDNSKNIIRNDRTELYFQCMYFYTENDVGAAQLPLVAGCETH